MRTMHGAYLPKVFCVFRILPGMKEVLFSPPSAELARSDLGIAPYAQELTFRRRGFPRFLFSQQKNDTIFQNR